MVEAIRLLGHRTVLEVKDPEQLSGDVIEEEYYSPDFPGGEDIEGLQGHEKLVRKKLSKSPVKLVKEPNGNLQLDECYECHSETAGTELPKPEIIVYPTGDIQPGNIIDDLRSHGLCQDHLRNMLEMVRKRREEKATKLNAS